MNVSKKYGIWASPFIHKARQRKMGTEAGYNVTNFGAAIGVDTKVNENKTIGFAWSNIKSILKHKDSKMGSKGVTNTNIFSLYGSIDLPNNYFISGIASYGISNVNNLDKRVLTKNISQFAKAKYKTKIYSGQFLAAKTIPFRSKYLITPLVGIKYAEFHDAAYKETGTDAQNYSVSKKKSKMLEGILGMKFSYPTSWNDNKMTPYLSAMANTHLKENPPTSFVSSDTFVNPIKIKGDKSSSKAWYVLGGGIDLHKGDIDYSFDYEAQLDKKYVGHQAKIKVRLNF